MRARLARLELQTRAEAAAAVPDNASAAKIDELSARLTRLETASAAAAPENGRTDIGRIDDLAARLSRLETTAAPGGFLLRAGCEQGGAGVGERRGI